MPEAVSGPHSPPDAPARPCRDPVGPLPSSLRPSPTWPDLPRDRPAPSGRVAPDRLHNPAAGWRGEAACAVPALPEEIRDAFTPEDVTAYYRDPRCWDAMDVCQACPVRAECLATAIDYSDYGIRGGLTDGDREIVAMMGWRFGDPVPEPRVFPADADSVETTVGNAAALALLHVSTVNKLINTGELPARLVYDPDVHRPVRIVDLPTVLARGEQARRLRVETFRGRGWAGRHYIARDVSADQPGRSWPGGARPLFEPASGHAEAAELLPASAARILYDRDWQPPEPEWADEPEWEDEPEWAAG